MSYIAIYIVMTLGSFACVLQMRDADGKHIEDIASLSGLSQTNKPLAAAFAILMFSLAGIPPLFGFWAKFLVFQAAVAANLLPLAAIGIAASVIGAYYYLRVIKTIYFDAPAAPLRPVQSYVEASVILVSSVVLVGGYLLIPLLAVTSNAAAMSLF
jgi:NADH-quinone oxidoreductase subunit N